MKYMRLTSLAFCTALAACGGGGNDSTGTTSNPAPQTAQGTFVDSPVQGLHYVSGSVSGDTDASGHFTYVPGQPVTFSVGGVTVGTASSGQALVTPAILAASAPNPATAVNNIAAFLQSLDSGGNIDQSIVIKSSTAKALSNVKFDASTVDLTAPSATASSVSTALAGDPAFTSGWTPISSATAQAHMNSQGVYTVYHYNAPALPGTADNVFIANNGTNPTSFTLPSGTSITLTPDSAGGYNWNNTVKYGMAFGILPSGATTPTYLPMIAMVCQAANPNDGTSGYKSTDLLVAQAAQKVTAATDLANVTLSTYWEDCSGDGGTQTNPPTAAKTQEWTTVITFDNAGNATITENNPPDPAQQTVTAANFNKLLTGSLGSAAGLTGQLASVWFQAYKYSAGTGTKYVLVMHAYNQAKNGGFISLMTQ